MKGIKVKAEAGAGLPTDAGAGLPTRDTLII